MLINLLSTTDFTLNLYDGRGVSLTSKPIHIFLSPDSLACTPTDVNPDSENIVVASEMKKKMKNYQGKWKIYFLKESGPC